MRDGGKQEPAEQRRAAHVRAVLAAALGSLAPFGTPPAHAANEEETRIAGIVVTVWTSPDATIGTHPVVVFSHGMYMCPTQSRFLTRALADAGYIVIAPRHADSNCEFSVGISDLSREIDGAAHLAWTDLGTAGREAIVGHAIAFLDHHVKGAPAGAALRIKLPGVARFAHDG